MNTDSYPFYYNPYMNHIVYEKFTDENLEEFVKEIIIGVVAIIVAIIAAIISTGIIDRVLLKMI